MTVHYDVKYQTFAAPGNTCNGGDFPTWSQAKIRRNEIFARPDIRRAWVVRIQEMPMRWDQSERYGQVLAREDSRCSPGNRGGMSTLHGPFSFGCSPRVTKCDTCGYVFGMDKRNTAP